jgi:hypothetical protein
LSWSPDRPALHYMLFALPNLRIAPDAGTIPFTPRASSADGPHCSIFRHPRRK